MGNAGRPSGSEDELMLWADARVWESSVEEAPCRKANSEATL